MLADSLGLGAFESVFLDSTTFVEYNFFLFVILVLCFVNMLCDIAVTIKGFSCTLVPRISCNDRMQ